MEEMEIRSVNTTSTRASWWLAGVTAIAMLAFSGNSLLTRMALQKTPLDPATFTAVRLATGAATLTLIVYVTGKRPTVSVHGVLSGTLLFIYVAAFSFAYRGIDTGAGALILFVSAQLMMLGFGYVKGEKTSLLGVALAVTGLFIFLAPSHSAPPLRYSALMLGAGIAWGAFSLIGRSNSSSIVGTANSFLLALPLAVVLLWVCRHDLRTSTEGLTYAAISGAVTSGLGYVMWYWVRVRTPAIIAGTVQLSVPVLSAVLGVVVLGEALPVHSAVAAVVVLLGVMLTMRTTRATTKPSIRRNSI
ncbi:eamA-like transporter family protein [Burkholderia ambifaria AMMD]|nr:eamA-like transporter family protein [Burkholderia ambifaria AMMD]MBR7932625.1 DMT family transporter [Burkholderia ambifaria]QQC08649.1 DMT family transporter [Burkholderia ambifaria]